jgi:class 3 adenylate cyclase/tetratricopeptide (TPR) repeat protein
LGLPPKPSPRDLSLDEKLAEIQRYLPKGLTEKILAQRGKIEGERKQVTVLFCDMEGFTALSERLGPEEAYSIMDQVYEILIHKVHNYEGTVNEMTGDGIIALFGAPIALEDAPQRAIRSSLAIHREMARFNDRLKQERKGIPPLRMRIGIHTGPVVVGTLGNDLRVEFKAVGDTVNLASRMEQLAEPGTIYVTEETFRLTEGLFRFEAQGEKEVKGREERVNVYHAIAPSTRRTRFDVSTERGLTPFVGRERELELLLDGLERSKSGSGQAFSIVSEAGVGKSRLLYEFRKAVASEDVTFLEGRCLSYSRGEAYHLHRDTLKANFDIGEADGDIEIRKKVERGLKILGADEASTIPYLLELLAVKDSGIDKIPVTPEERKHRIIEALKRIVLKGSEIRPLILAYEDLHWADNSSEEVLKYVLESIPGARVLLIFTYRPEFVHAWGAKSYHSQVMLNRLSNRESLMMVSHLLGTEELDKDFEEFILEKTEGVPFFIEELIKSLKDLKIIERKNDRYHLAKDLSEVTIPATVQDVIMARVDSLPEGSKSLLQTMSVIGREFSYDLINRITGLTEQELLSQLSVLKDSELLYERGIYPQSTYIFKHALTQEVAYNSLLLKRRKEIHEKIGEAIEALYPDRLEEHYELLAYHYSKTEEAKKAIEYLSRFAEKAARMYAHDEAVKALEEALVHAERLPIEERDRPLLDLAVRQAESLHFLGRRQEIVDLLLHYQDCLERLREPSLASQYYFWLGFAHAWLGHRAEAAQSLHRSLEEATRVGDRSVMGRVHRALCLEYAYSGQPLDEAVAHGRQAVSLLERAEDHFWLSQALLTLGICLYYTGDFELALEDAARLDAVGEATGNRRARTNATMVIGLSYATRGDWAKGIEACERALELSPDPFETAFVLACLGRACWEAGDVARAVPVLEQAIQLADRVRSLQWRCWFRTWLGDAYLLNGQTNKAREVVGKALETSADVKFLVGVGLSHQVLGRIACAEGFLAEAQRHLTDALQTLASINCRFEAGRTHLDLAAVAHAQGKREAVATHLKEAHSLFRASRVPKYVERAEQLATQFGVPISE